MQRWFAGTIDQELVPEIIRLMRIARVLVFISAATLSACATLPDSQAPDAAPPAASENNAVVALVQNARSNVSAGELGSAAANLERALRIEPRNPALWHELARVNLHQGKPLQAAQFAGKSNTFAGENAVLKAANWRLIGQARTQSGDHAAAEAAFQKAAELEKQL